MSTDTLSKTYDPHAIEQVLYDRWEQAGWFAPRGDGEPYCIMIPPPNVTGSLHMGHAFQDTVMDTLIRYHRMHGRRTLWQAGSDHAGIATQMVVERQLETQGQSRRGLGREAFVERVWQWKHQSGGTITQQLRRLGASLDWEHERFTMDEGLSAAVLEVFVRLHEQGLIYRGKRLVNWDPVLHTAISDLEVVAEEEAGHLWHIRYPLADDSGHLVVATTRPETMLGDTAVAVHPDDRRYAHLIGKKARVPLTGRDVPIIADDYVDPEFGSGCVKITPGHDFNDYEVGQRHNLPIINIFNDDAAINLPDSPYHRLDRFEARQRVVDDLESQGVLERVEDHKLRVPRGDRSLAVAEPYLTDQWYVRAAPLAEASIKVVEDGIIRFVPENWSRTYFEWMRNIQDWCISRQLWWGHRIPAWYDDEGNVFVARDEPAALAQAKAKHGHEVPLTQDPDVLDTWFSSALWPFSTLGWPQQTDRLNTFYPTTVLVTGFDIIFFWVARMIMMGLQFTGERPFDEVYVHGLVRDAEGQKMSKSKGNILDPLDLIDGIELESLVAKRTTGLMQPHMAGRIEKATRKQFPDGIPSYGADALRFTFASLATQGMDIRFDLGRIDGYRNFCNKLWNAARYVLMNIEAQDYALNSGEMEFTLADRWIVSRLQQVEQQVAEAIRQYRLDQMAQSLYSFTWDEYCSWYVELSKVVLTDPQSSVETLRGTRQTLARVLETVLRLLHPIIPFITEEIWLKVAPLAGKRGKTVMLEPYPTAEPNKIDADALQEMQWMQAVVTGVRNIRGESNIEPGKRLPVLLSDMSDRDSTYLSRNQAYIKTLARLQSIEPLEPLKYTEPKAATALVGNMKVLVPLGSLIDRDAELERLTRDIHKLEKDVARSRGKLENSNFVDRAPKKVVAKERDRLVEIENALSNLREQYEKVRSLTL